MKKIIADQNFHGPTLRGLIARIRNLDFVRTEDIGLKRFQDTNILEWAAEHDRLVLTHDARTFINFAYERMAQGKDFHGVIVVPASLSIRSSIEDLAMILECSSDDEFLNSFVRLPI